MSRRGGGSSFTLVPALIAGLFSQAALFGLRPVLSYRAIDLGMGAAEIGVLTASFAVLPIFLAIPLGRVIDRHGGRRVAIAGATVTTLCGVGFVLADSYALLIVLNVLTGVGQLALVLAVQWSIGALSADRDRSFAQFSLATSVGHVLGPVLATGLGTLGADAGLSFFVFAFAFCAAGQAIAAIAVFWLPLPIAVVAGSGAPARMPLGEILRAPGMKNAVFASFVTLVAIDLLMAYLPLWAEGRGITAVAVGWLLAIRGAGSLLSRLCLPYLVGRFRHLAVASVSTLLTSASMAGLIFADLVGAGILVAIIGMTLGLMQPLTMSWVVLLAPAGSVGAALALRLTANRFGQVAVPLAAAGVATVVASPVEVVFLMAGGLLFSSSVASIPLRRRRSPG